jgi:hypothetical protein
MQAETATLTSRLEALARRADALLPANLAEPDRAMLRDIAAFAIVLFVGTLLAYIATISWRMPFPRDGTTLVVGRDFLHFWLYGQAVVSSDPARFYDQAAFNGYLATLLGPGYPGQTWSYPPSVMFFAAPFGQIGYFPALLLWTAGGVTLFWAVASRYAHSLNLDGKLLIPVLISPAAVFCVMSGQASFFTASLLVGAFLCLDRRPLVAGVLIGLLTIKPQLGLLFPVMLIASGRWRVFCAAAVTAVVLAGGTALVFGAETWVAFFTKSLPVQNAVMADPGRITTPFLPTVFMNIRGLDAPYGVAMAAQALFSIVAVAVVAYAFSRHRNAPPHILFALFLVCAVSFSPYLLSYDLLAATFAAVILLAAGGLDPLGRRLAQLLYWTPVLQLALGIFHIPGPGLIPPAMMVYLFLALRRVEPAGHPRPIGAPAAG